MLSGVNEICDVVERALLAPEDEHGSDLGLLGQARSETADREVWGIKASEDLTVEREHL